eukprot:544736_1
MTSRKHRSKVEKSNEEFRQHERELMIKRISEINNIITKKSTTIWDQYLFHKPKPPNVCIKFQYEGLEEYLKVSDCYKETEHKDPKQKWWNNQKASEMSQDFLPSVLNATDQMSMFIGKQIHNALQNEFTQYVIFELLETAISSTFKTLRSGSNEVFLRTSFQYSKAQFRHKLVNYFKASELVDFDVKQRKKKENWLRLIRDKRDKLLSTFLQKKSMVIDTSTSNNNSIYGSSDRSPSTISSDNMTLNNIQFSQDSSAMQLPTPMHPKHNSNNMQIPYWNEIQTQQQKTYTGPYDSMNNGQIMNSHNQCTTSNSYGHHRQCGYCDNYLLKISDLLNENKKLKMINQSHELERIRWRNKYSDLLSNFQRLAEIITNNNAIINHEQQPQTSQQQQQLVYNDNYSQIGNIGNDQMSAVNFGNDEWMMNQSVNLNNPMTLVQNDIDSFTNYS